MNTRPMKRARTTSFIIAKRPIDKSIINVVKTLAADTQVSTELVNASFPCTISGLRWNGAVETGTTPSQVRWAIILVKDGNAANAFSVTDGSTLYEPEQNVLAWGIEVIQEQNGAGPAVMKIDGSTKTMRKLMRDDKLLLIVRSSQISTLTAGVQFFCRT